MHEFFGDLCIGGLRLKHLHGELDQDTPLEGSSDWLLAGRLSIAPSQQELLQFNRLYRLQLEDGRAGAVVVSRIESDKSDELTVEFHPVRAPAKPR
jgi:hypothetical protein